MGFLWGILIVLFLNWLIFPNLTNRKINVTDYGTFIGKMEEGKIKEVMIKNNQIYFTVAEDGPTRREKSTTRNWWTACWKPKARTPPEK